MCHLVYAELHAHAISAASSPPRRGSNPDANGPKDKVHTSRVLLYESEACAGELDPI